MSHRGAKWADVPAGAIAASVADMDLPPPEAVLEAAMTAVTAHDGYPSPAEVDELVDAGAAWWGARHGTSLAAERCVPVSSVAAGAAWAIVRLTSPGDGVVRLRPGYPPLTDAVRSTGRDDRPVDLVGDGAGGWRLDLDALDAACRGARMLLWVSPHNPTGRVWSREEVEAVVEVAARHDLWVVADEVWADLVLAAGARHVGVHAVASDVAPAVASRTVTFVTTTKPWNLAGLGCGMLHTGSDDVHAALRGDGVVPLVPTPARASLAASTAAWRGGGQWLDETLVHLRAVVDDAVGRLRASLGDARVTVPEATYTVWVDARGLVDDDDPAGRLAVPGGVVPTDGATYGAPGFLRLNLAVPAATATTIVDRVLAVLSPPGR